MVPLLNVPSDSSFSVAVPYISRRITCNLNTKITCTDRTRRKARGAARCSHGAVSGDCRVARATEVSVQTLCRGCCQIADTESFHQRIAHSGSSPLPGSGVADPQWQVCPPGR